MIDTALCFSGGKDSLACLYLNKDKWDDIYVVWVNTQAVYKEQYDYMMKWKEKLPHFVEVKSNQPLSIYENGWPVDIVPVTNMVFGKVISGNTGPLFQSWISCCSQNIWTPLNTAVRELGVTKVIKGQKIADGLKSPSRNGMVVDGLEYVQPLDNWTEKQGPRCLTTTQMVRKLAEIVGTVQHICTTIKSVLIIYLRIGKQK
jgi:3'-phosphoadenosine 5'-phosphosulfate sulfotransferase (PAPS reductase)/FAD synthetase